MDKIVNDLTRSLDMNLDGSSEIWHTYLFVEDRKSLFTGIIGIRVPGATIGDIKMECGHIASVELYQTPIASFRKSVSKVIKDFYGADIKMLHNERDAD